MKTKMNKYHPKMNKYHQFSFFFCLEIFSQIETNLLYHRNFFLKGQTFAVPYFQVCLFLEIIFSRRPIFWDKVAQIVFSIVKNDCHFVLYMYILNSYHGLNPAALSIGKFFWFHILPVNKLTVFFNGTMFPKFIPIGTKWHR